MAAGSIEGSERTMQSTPIPVTRKETTYTHANSRTVRNASVRSSFSVLNRCSRYVETRENGLGCRQVSATTGTSRMANRHGLFLTSGSDMIPQAATTIEAAVT